MDWTAKVQVGQSTASVVGSGTLNVGDVIGDALGLAGIELSSVLLSEPDHLTVGFQAGTRSGPLMMATIVVERSPED